MKGNDIKKSSAKPYLTLQATDNQRVIKLSELGARD
jgi:hypothetical protein